VKFTGALMRKHSRQ